MDPMANILSQILRVKNSTVSWRALFSFYSCAIRFLSSRIWFLIYIIVDITGNLKIYCRRYFLSGRIGKTQDIYN
ncbi:hypothetical protein AB8U03_17320, partial [Clostridium sp. Mt-5]